MILPMRVAQYAALLPAALVITSLVDSTAAQAQVIAPSSAGIVQIEAGGPAIPRNRIVQADPSARELTDISAVELLFRQPESGALADYFIVPPASHIPPPNAKYRLVLWQPNPNQSDGSMVPTAWNAGSRTGFYPSPPLLSKQLGFEDRAGTTTVQMDGDTVGVYLSSVDLPPETHKQKMMITPSFKFQPGLEPLPFQGPSSTLNASMDLQVPTARDAHRPGSEIYIVTEFLFKDRQGGLLSYGVTLFFNGVPRSKVQVGRDEDTNSLMLTTPLGEDERFASRGQNSLPKVSAPWLGWRHFEFAITRAQFFTALQEMANRFPDKFHVANPADYKLAQVHLNAELHFRAGPAELGWAMRRMKVWRG